MRTTVVWKLAVLVFFISATSRADEPYPEATCGETITPPVPARTQAVQPSELRPATHIADPMNSISRVTTAEFVERCRATPEKSIYEVRQVSAEGPLPVAKSQIATSMDVEMLRANPLGIPGSSPPFPVRLAGNPAIEPHENANMDENSRQRHTQPHQLERISELLGEVPMRTPGMDASHGRRHASIANGKISRPNGMANPRHLESSVTASPSWHPRPVSKSDLTWRERIWSSWKRERAESHPKSVRQRLMEGDPELATDATRSRR